MELEVREIREDELQKICDYFLGGNDAFLQGMGVDVAKLPSRADWLKLLNDEHNKSISSKKFFYVIWSVDGKVVGHSNINKIVFGKEAYMHLHMWQPDIRRTGLGTEMVKRSIPFYFNKFDLKNLYCEPYALNPAPNAVLPKVGFELIRTYETTPGWINFHQPVNRWTLTFDRYKTLYF